VSLKKLYGVLLNDQVRSGLTTKCVFEENTNYLNSSIEVIEFLNDENLKEKDYKWKLRITDK
jgi:hypothetical protein